MGLGFWIWGVCHDSEGPRGCGLLTLILGGVETFIFPASEGDRSLEVSNYAALRFDVKGRPKPLRVIRLPWGRECEEGGT